MAEAQELVNLINKFISRPNTTQNTPTHSRPTTPIPLSGESPSGQSAPQPLPRGYKDYSRPSKFAIQTSRAVGTQTEIQTVDNFSIHKSLGELENRRTTASRQIQYNQASIDATVRAIKNNIASIDNSYNSCLCWVFSFIFICLAIVIGLSIYSILIAKSIV